MEIHEPGTYHIYNRGNNKQQIFFSRDNYLYFLKKTYSYVKPVSEILAWCLMPNHFHFLVEVDAKSLIPVKVGSISMPAITNGFRLLQSSYAKGINKQEGRTGNLFQQKTKAKLLDTATDHVSIAFFYIHQNPVSANLVNQPHKWEFSSYKEFVDKTNNCLANTELAIKLFNLSLIDFNKRVTEDQLQKINLIF